MEGVPVALHRLDGAVYSPPLCCWPCSKCPPTLLLEGERKAIVRSAAGLNAFAGRQFGVTRTVGPLVWNLLSFWIKIKKNNLGTFYLNLSLAKNPPNNPLKK